MPKTGITKTKKCAIIKAEATTGWLPRVALKPGALGKTEREEHANPDPSNMTFLKRESATGLIRRPTNCEGLFILPRKTKPDVVK